MKNPKRNRGTEKIAKEEWFKKRQRMLNKAFVWTPAHVQAFKELNDGLLLKYKEAYDEMLRLRNEYEAFYEQGNERYCDYSIEIEF